MKSLHHKAYQFTRRTKYSNGKTLLSTHYIAITPGVNIDSLIKQWNLHCPARYQYELISDIDLTIAMNAKSKNGFSIERHWKLLDNMPFHSVEIDCIEL